MKRSGVIALLVALTFLAACGQKGALYFAPEKVVEQKPAPKSDSKPTEQNGDSPIKKEPSDGSQ